VTKTPVLTPTPPAAAFPTEPGLVSINRLSPAPAQNSYRFLVAGHIYGAPEPGRNHPADTLVQAVPMLRDKDYSFLVSLGDIVPDEKPESYQAVKDNLLGPLGIPVFNVVGNHDVIDRAYYTQTFGRTYYTFRYGAAQMIFLDTELTQCQVRGLQRSFLVEALRQASQDQAVKTIFVFMHKTVFIDSKVLNESGKWLAGPNDWLCFDKNNFADLLEKDFRPAARGKSLVFFAGDVGAYGGNLSPYYEKRADQNITLITTGLGDNPKRDLPVQVTVEGEQVKFELISLSGREVKTLESYNRAYWEELAKKPE
jgi:hypothetical protein